MGRNPWEDADPDFAALGGRRSGFRWGRLFVGLILVACGTVIAGYYLPLYRAHQALSSDHQRVVDKAQGLERQAVELRGQLTSAESKVSALEAERQRPAAPAASSNDEGTARLKADIASKLEKHTKKGSVTIGSDSGRVLVAIADSAVFAPRKLDVSAQGKALLCDVAKAAGNQALVVAAVDSNETPAAPFAQKYPTAWSLRAARASSAANELEEACGIPSARLAAQALGKARAGAFGSEKVPSTRIEIEIATKPGG